MQQQKIQVLFVEDDATVRMVITHWFRHFKETHEFLLAENGKEALDLLRTKPVDVVVTDLQMPVMDGFELITRMTEEFPRIPVIVATALDAGSIDKLSQVGSFRVLRKPFELNSMKSAIDTEIDAVNHGALFGISMASFLQLIEMEQKTCTLRVTEGGTVGYLYFNDGMLSDAETENLTGEEAARRIVVWSRPEIQITTAFSKKEKVISISLSSLLLDSFRLLDEASANGARPPSGEGDVAPTNALHETRQEGFGATKAKGVSGPLGRSHQTLEVFSDDPNGGPFSKVPAESAESVEATDSKIVYGMAPELARQFQAGELPQQTANLLIFFDGKTPFEEIINIVPDQEEALRNLVADLEASGLLLDSAKVVSATAPSSSGTISGPRISEVLPPLPHCEALPAPDHTYFLPSDGLVLAQSLRMSLGMVPEVVYLASVGLPQAYRLALAKTLRHMGESQRTVLTREPLDNSSTVPHEMARLPLRSDLRISVIDVQSCTDFKQYQGLENHSLGGLLFLSGHDGLPDSILTSIAVHYPGLVNRPLVVNLLNVDPDFLDEFRDRVATTFDISTESVGCWNIQDPIEIAQAVNLLIQNSMVF
jgi:CheY-like chemotaxis protein